MPNYTDEQWQKNTIKLREVISELPPFCQSFFIDIEYKTTILTQLNYAYDLRIFFDYAFDNIPVFRNKNRLELKPEILNEIKLRDINAFLNYVTIYEDKNSNKTNSNHEHGKARKIATLRSFFKHYYKNEYIAENICDRLETPKIHEKAIIRLEPNEIADLLDAVENQTNFTERQKKLNAKNRLRDLAIFTLFLSTGIRVSELVSLNISDIQFDTNAFTVVRKGGNQIQLFFGDEAKTALLNYIQERKEKGTYELASPLFLSSSGDMNRLTVRAVENLVKKYTQGAVPLKHISPHKLRSTFGTMLYQETGDIYMVADVLDHKDINTTRKHYAAIKEDSRRQASKVVKLRD